MAKGYNRGPSGGGMGGGMMQQIKRMQEQMVEAQSKLAEETVTASVGGGTVQVTVTGAKVCKAVVIDPEMLKDADAEMLQDMLLSAFNLAMEKADKLTEERMGPLASGLGGLGF